MRSFSAPDIARAFARDGRFTTPAPEGYALDYRWTRGKKYLVLYRILSAPSAGATVLSFLGYLDTPEAEPLTSNADAYGVITDSGFVEFQFGLSVASGYQDLKDLLGLVLAARDWAEDHAVIAR